MKYEKINEVTNYLVNFGGGQNLDTGHILFISTSYFCDGSYFLIKLFDIIKHKHFLECKYYQIKSSNNFHSPHPKRNKQMNFYSK